MLNFVPSQYYPWVRAFYIHTTSAKQDKKEHHNDCVGEADRIAVTNYKFFSKFVFEICWLVPTCPDPKALTNFHLFPFVFSSERMKEKDTIQSLETRKQIEVGWIVLEGDGRRLEHLLPSNLSIQRGFKNLSEEFVGTNFFQKFVTTANDKYFQNIAVQQTGMHYI